MMRNKNQSIFMILILIGTLLLAACTSSGSEPAADENTNETTSENSDSALTEVEVVEDSIVENVEEVDSSGPASLPVADAESGDEAMPNSDEPESDGGAVEPVTVNLGDITPEAGDSENVVQPAPGVPDPGVKMANVAMQDLAERLEMDISEIDVVTMEEVEWNDGSLGCPQEGYAYVQVITSGFQITLQTSDAEYIYHTDLNQQAVLCTDGVATP